MLQGSHCPVLVHELSPLVLFLVQDSDRTITTTWIVLRISPTFCSMVGQSRSPLLVQCRSIVYDAVSTLLQHWTNTWFFYTSVYSNHRTANQCCFNAQHYFNQNPLSSYYRPNHEYNREYYYFWTLVKDKSTVLNLRSSKRHIRHVQKDWCTKMTTVTHTQHPSFP